MSKTSPAIAILTENSSRRAVDNLPRKWEIAIGDRVFEATLLEKLAPVTCEALVKCLPYEGEAIHSSWSGDCLYVPWKMDKISPENQTIYGSTGDIAWQTALNDEIFITYGTSQYRYRFGALPCNLFAKITNDLEELGRVSNEIRRHGIKKVVIREV